MGLTTTAGALRDALATARHATPTSPSLVAYSGVLLVVSGSDLAIHGSDGETTITASLKVSDAKSGQALLLPRPLGNYLATLEPDTSITVSLSGTGDLQVKPTSSSAYKFRPVSSTFPLPAAPKVAPRAVDLSRLGQALAAVRSSVAKDNPGVQLVSSDSGLTLHTTDNYRLSRAVLPEAGFGDFAGVVPLGVLDRLSRSNVNQVSVDTKGRTLRFAGPDVSITTRLLSVAFPAVEGVLDSTPPSSVTVPTSGMRRALARLAAVADQAPLKCRIEDDTLTLSVANADLGSGAESVELPTNVPAAFEFMVKLSYLADAFAAHEGDTLDIGYSAPVQPLFLRSSTPLSVTSVVMPVRG